MCTVFKKQLSCQAIPPPFPLPLSSSASCLCLPCPESRGKSRATSSAQHFRSWVLCIFECPHTHTHQRTHTQAYPHTLTLALVLCAAFVALSRAMAKLHFAFLLSPQCTSSLLVCVCLYVCVCLVCSAALRPTHKLVLTRHCHAVVHPIVAPLTGLLVAD